MVDNIIILSVPFQTSIFSSKDLAGLSLEIVFIDTVNLGKCTADTRHFLHILRILIWKKIPHFAVKVSMSLSLSLCLDLNNPNTTNL